MYTNLENYLLASIHHFIEKIEDLIFEKYANPLNRR
jgi:hypothetical protein